MALAMLVGACIGLSVVVVLFGHRFGWRPSRAWVAVVLCGVVASAAIWKWRSLDVDIAAEVERKLEALSRCYRFEASLRKSVMFALLVGAVLWPAMALLATREPTIMRLALGAVGLLTLAALIMTFGYAVKPGPTLVMDARGLYHAGFGRIPWDAIVGLQYGETEIAAAANASSSERSGSPSRRRIASHAGSRGWRCACGRGLPPPPPPSATC